jgi:apolipoprotein N-acyltransferase
MEVDKMIMANPQTPARSREGTTSQPRRSAADPQEQTSETWEVWAKRGWLPNLVPALASAALLWSCYFPLAQGWLAWVALVPLLTLVRSPARSRYIYWSAYAGGLAFFWPVLQWLRVGDYNMMYYSWGALATYCAAYFPLAIFLTRQIDRRTSLPLVVVFPAVWTALEFLRSYLLTGFPWYFLAHTQHDYLSLIQISDLSGAYAVSFLVAAANALIFELLNRTRWFRALFALDEASKVSKTSKVWISRRRTLWVQSVGFTLLLVSTLVYGAFRLNQNSFDTGPRLALIQGNLDQEIRNDASSSEPMVQATFDHFGRLCDRAALQNPPPQLIVWPENSCPRDWTENPSGHPVPRSLHFANWAADLWKTNLLIGMEAYVQESDEEERRYNSAVLILARQGSRSVEGLPSGRYDKMHRVPFGEYVPFQESMPWMKTFAPYDFEYSIRSGKQFTHFHLGPNQFGVLICFEDTDPVLARQYVRDPEAKADFFINISNDGWWRGTSGHDQHLAISRFRAVENRRAVCRAVNMGISAVIDGNGRVREPRTIQTSDNTKIWQIPSDPSSTAELPVSRWSEFKQVQGVLLASVPIDHRSSFYARWGDWLPWTCWLLVVVGLGWPPFGRFVSKMA